MPVDDLGRIGEAVLDPPAASASEDLAAAEALADHASGRSADAVAAAARLRALGGSNSQADPLRLQERVERRLGHG